MVAADRPPQLDRFEGLKLAGTPLVTSEVRWFASGPPPASVVSWFSENGRAAFVELRRDAYRIGADFEIGLKRRDRGPLELKRRQGISSQQEFLPGLGGRVEEWRKDGLEEPPSTAEWRWSVVDKVVLTRTFARGDSGSVVEIAHPRSHSSACDIELASVTAGSTLAWTFALEAWGERNERRDLLHSSLGALIEKLPTAPSQLVAALSSNMGYPEWLASTIWADDRVTSE